jgi:hypothetical protein
MIPIDIAKKYLEKTEPHMDGAVLEVHPHETSDDYALVPHLMSHGITDDHIDDSKADIVVASKDFQTEDGATITRILKLKVKDGEVKSTLESK